MSSTSEGSIENAAQSVKPKELALMITVGHQVKDASLDALYPPPISALSENHWTPIDVAKRAASLLVVDQSTRVLDIGSGCGKFCIVGALTTRAWFFGIEQRPSLVDISKKIAVKMGVDRVSFFLGNMIDFDWSPFNAFYLFNPFYENRLKLIKIDDTVPLSQEQFKTYVDTVKVKLSTAKAGTRVVTYHGFGAAMPSGFQLMRQEAIGTGELELWVK